MCCAARNIPASSSMLIEASNALLDGVLMPMIGTCVRRSCSTSFGSIANDATNTASTLRSTGRFTKNDSRFFASSMCWKSEMSYPASCSTELRPAKTWVLNQLVTSSFISSATRNVCPDLSAVAEREMLKSSIDAASMTRSRVFSETSSGRVNARETVEIDTPAICATSRMPFLCTIAPFGGEIGQLRWMVGIRAPCMRRRGGWLGRPRRTPMASRSGGSRALHCGSAGTRRRSRGRCPRRRPVSRR